MPEKTDRKAEGRARILDGAARGFRRFGFGGVGVDGLAKEAGLTSGAFYVHFPSKADAFRETVVAGLVDLRRGIRQIRDTCGPHWLRHFIEFYTADRRTCDLAESCALQSLTGEVARSTDAARHAYQQQLDAILDDMADGMDGGSLSKRRARATALLALLAGGVSLARAVKDEDAGNAIADAVRVAALALATEASG